MKRLIPILLISLFGCVQSPSKQKEELIQKLRPVLENYYNALLTEEGKGGKIDSLIIIRVDTMTERSIQIAKANFFKGESDRHLELLRKAQNLLDISIEMAQLMGKSARTAQNRIVMEEAEKDLGKVKEYDSLAMVHFKKAELADTQYIKGFLPMLRLKISDSKGVQQLFDSIYAPMTVDFKIMDENWIKSHK